MSHPVRPSPLALRSYLEWQPAAPAIEGAPLPLTQGGSTFTMAQEAVWLDEEHFSVGRWDGSLKIHQYSSLPNVGPLISKAVNDPAGEGVQMELAVDERQFLTSNDEASLAFWLAPAPRAWTGVSCAQRLQYPHGLGAANSATLLRRGTSAPFIVVGHANGLLSFWRSAGSTWEITSDLDIRLSVRKCPI